MGDSSESIAKAAGEHQLTQQLRARDEFLSVLTHELRTPLTPMTTALALLREDARLNAELLPALRIVQRNMDALARLVDDLDDAWRLRESKLSLVRADVDLHALIKESAPRWSREAEVRGLTLSLALEAESARVVGDGARLTQLVSSLVANALKFTPDGRGIRVVTSSPIPGQIVVQIIDEGIGVDARLLPHVFDGWSLPMPAGLRRHGGLGLGLPIARELAALHGGMVTVTSAGRDLGCTATVTLPLGRTTTEIQADKPKQNRALRVLLVDDHEDTLMLTKIMLERRGYTVMTASTMQLALELSREQPYDLVISDIVLPDGSGLELFATLKQETNVVGIALSGFGRDADIQRSKDVGFAEHLTKPVNIARLHESIQRLFEENR